MISVSSVREVVADKFVNKTSQSKVMFRHEVFNIIKKMSVFIRAYVKMLKGVLVANRSIEWIFFHTTSPQMSNDCGRFFNSIGD